MPTHSRKARGFTLVEVIIAMFILVIGLVGLLALFSQSIGQMQWVQEDLIAKQKARETLESIYTARNTQQIVFQDIQNTADGGIFLGGFQPLRQPNPAGGGGDGLVGTADDGPIEQLLFPGPDGLLGTGDDIVRSLGYMQRQIVIQPLMGPGPDGVAGTADDVVNPDLRQITIAFRYTVAGGQQRTYQVGSYISRFR